MITRHKILWIIALMAAVWQGCADTGGEATPPEPNPAEQLILAVRGTDRLYTTEYVVNKIVTYDDIIKVKGSVFSKKFDFKVPQGSRKVLIPMEARIKAYIDFSAFGPENVVYNADSSEIRIILPDPKIELTSTTIDHKGIISLVDFGRSRFTQTEMSEYEKQGRAAIVHAIPAMDIPARARLDAFRVLMPMIEALGYEREHITIDFRKDFTDTDYLNNLITTEMSR